MAFRIDEAFTRANVPYRLRADQHGQRFFMDVETAQGWIAMPSQFGSMDRDTASRVYRQYRDRWLAQHSASKISA